MSCKGICTSYKAAGCGGRRPNYTQGNKRCSTCELFIKWDGVGCPCCGNRLRLDTRRRKFKVIGDDDKRIEMADFCGVEA